MSSIYVSMCSLDDTELIPTINNMLKSCSNDNTVKIGLRLLSDDDKFINTVTKFVRKNKNISFKVDKINKQNAKSLLGVGMGRFEAIKFYNNEDYFLQIDSHSLFAKDWDKTMIKLYKEAKEYTNLEKLILTAYAGHYTFNKKNKREFGNPHAGNNGRPRYVKFISSQSFYDVVPGWKDVEENISDPFVPIAKVNANFLFTDGSFALNSGISKDIIFFEEEILQTLELSKLGYSFVYPNIDYPVIGHYYTLEGDRDYNDRRKILGDYSIYYDRLFLTIKARNNFIKYINAPENQEIIERYNKYIGWEFDLKNPNNKYNTGIPSSFIV